MGASKKVLAIAVGGALLLGLILGFVVGRASVGEPKAADIVERLKEELGPVGNGLELLPNEYAQAQAGSGDEAVGVKGNVERIVDGVDASLEDLRVLDPSGARELDGAVNSLAGAVNGGAPRSRSPSSPRPLRARSSAFPAAAEPLPAPPAHPRTA